MVRRTCAKVDFVCIPVAARLECSSAEANRATASTPPARGMAKGGVGAHGKAKAVAKRRANTKGEVAYNSKMYALIHSPVVVRVAAFPFLNFNISSTCGGNPATCFPN